MKRILCFLLSLAIFPSLIFAQNYGNYGINPIKDAAYISKFNERSDSIRQHRPVVALVLSGGGAKGVAHIGAIRRIEEMGIPVDMILGTSMGGLIGGMMALGYSTDEMEKAVLDADWSYLITDKQPREFLSLKEMNYKAQHQIILPFFFEKEYFQQRKESAYAQEGKPRKYSPLSLGAESDDKKALRDNVWESMPESYVPGQNVTNLINSFAVGYTEDMDFMDLPIPFVCMASDMVSLQAKRWYSGKLSKALRSTMSIPVLFAPVRTAGMVLVDGGMRDNYPVELAKELGADIVIGVELSGAKKRYSDVNNLGDIVMQGVDMLGADAFIANENAADVKIKPYLPEYGMLSFEDESIPIIIERGYEAAVKEDSLLLDVKSRVGGAKTVHYAPKAVSLGDKKLRINEIEIRGINEKEKTMLIDKLGLIPGGLVDKERLDRLVASIVSYQSFESVTYELHGKEEPYKLVLNCKKGPVHQIGVGARFDTEEVVTANINIGFNARKLQGSRFDLNAKISVNPTVSFLYSYDSPYTPTFNFESKVAYSDMGRMNLGASTFNISPERITANMWKIAFDAYVSNIKWRRVDLRGGLRSEYFSIGGNIDRSLYQNRMGQDQYYLEPRRADYFTLYLDASDQTYDKYYFPTKGYKLGVYYGWTFAGFGEALEFHNFHTMAVNGRLVVPAGKFFTFIPSFGMRFLLSSETFRRRHEETPLSTVPFPFMNIIGGRIQGRYLDQQLPFVGLNYATCLDNIMMMVRTDFQFRIAKNNYITGTLNYARDCHRFATIAQGRDYFGGGLEYAYNTFVGPFSIDIHWSNLTRLPGIYASFGYIF